MKKLNLMIISLLFSSLLIGCGMTGPLYRVPETQTIEKQQTEPETKPVEQNNETLEDENNIS